MNPVDKAVETQLRNIEKRTGKTLEELALLINKSGLSKHGEIRDMLKRDLGMGHGDANTLVHHVLKAAGTGAAKAEEARPADVLDEIYSGAKAALRPIHDRLMEAINALGPFEVAPKKGYVSLRRKKQFAMIGPATNTRVEVGLNGKDIGPAERLETQPPASMCHFKVKITDLTQVDEELIGFIKKAYEGAG